MTQSSISSSQSSKGLLKEPKIRKPRNLTKIYNRRHGYGTGCCSRFCAEFSIESLGEKDTNGLTIDLQASFCTEGTGKAWTDVVKFLLWAATLAVFCNGWLGARPNLEFYLAYLTNWSLTYALIYMTLSLLNTWCYDFVPLIKATWIMYSIAAVHQIGVTILFWFVEYDRLFHVPTFYTVMSHGGVAILVLIDGLVVNKVPVRLKHYTYNFVLASLYIGWTVFQNLALEYNPNADGQDDDIALYEPVKWKKEPVKAALVTAFALFVFLPADQLFIWSLSLCNRRYKAEVNNGYTDMELGITKSISWKDVSDREDSTRVDI